MSYISTFISTLPKTQRQAIKSLLADKSYRKDIPTLSELLKNIGELSSKINLTSDSSIPLVMSLPIDNRSGSFGLNDVSQYFRRDLNSLYIELDNIALLFEQVSRLIKLDEIAISKTLRELDDSLTRIEILNNYKQDLYSLVMLNSFNSAESSSLSVAHSLAKYLYTDPRTNEVYGNDDILYLDQEKEGALLPLENIGRVKPKRIYVSSGSNTTESDIEINSQTYFEGFLSEAPNNYADNLKFLDNRVWIHPVFIKQTKDKSTPPLSVSCELVVDFGGFNSINYLRLSLGMPFSVTVSSIQYEGADGQIYSIVNQPFVLSKNINLTFSRVVASKVFIQFTQKSYADLVLDKTEAVDSPTATLPFKYSNETSFIGKELLDSLSLLPNIKNRSFPGWLYIFGLDYLSVGLGEYKSVGTFVSEPVSVGNIVDRCSLNSLASKSTDVSGNYGETIEYYLHIFEYDRSHKLLNRLVTPILPVSEGEIEHELLLLNNSGIGSLRFFPDVNEEINVYKDWTPLVAGDDYMISVDYGNTYEDNPVYVSSPSGPPYEYQISINALSDTSIYTVTYTPKKSIISDGYPMYVGSSKIAILEDDSSIKFIYPEARKKQVTTSEVFVTMVCRSLAYDSSFRSTCIVFDYTLFVK